MDEEGEAVQDLSSIKMLKVICFQCFEAACPVITPPNRLQAAGHIASGRRSPFIVPSSTHPLCRGR